MMATLALLTLLAGFLLVLSYAAAAGGPARLGHGLREFDRLSRLYAGSVDDGRRLLHR
jgi:hypothetical protein